MDLPKLETLLIVLYFIHLASTAPVQDFLRLSHRAPRMQGCSYKDVHYENGQQIITKEPCLNCTCQKSRLRCYLRVCPILKPIGDECVEIKEENECCPKIWCPNEGCFLNDKYYPDGAMLPHDSKKPCEVCYCIRNSTFCVVQECELKVDGCSPVYKHGQCCPCRYNCSYEETTTVPPGFSVEDLSEGCHLNDGRFIADGEADNSTNPCEHCYCMRNEMVCAIQECQAPEDNCRPLLPKPGQCCPDRYECPSKDEATTLSFSTVFKSEYPTPVSITKEDEIKTPSIKGIGIKGAFSLPSHLKPVGTKEHFETKLTESSSSISSRDILSTTSNQNVDQDYSSKPESDDIIIETTTKELNIGEGVDSMLESEDLNEEFNHSEKDSNKKEMEVFLDENITSLSTEITKIDIKSTKPEILEFINEKLTPSSVYDDFSIDFKHTEKEDNEKDSDSIYISVEEYNQTEKEDKQNTEHFSDVTFDRNISSSSTEIPLNNNDSTLTPKIVDLTSKIPSIYNNISIHSENENNEQNPKLLPGDTFHEISTLLLTEITSSTAKPEKLKPISEMFQTSTVSQSEIVSPEEINIAKNPLEEKFAIQNISDDRINETYSNVSEFPTKMQDNSYLKTKVNESSLGTTVESIFLKQTVKIPLNHEISESGNKDSIESNIGVKWWHQDNFNKSSKDSLEIKFNNTDEVVTNSNHFFKPPIDIQSDSLELIPSQKKHSNNETATNIHDETSRDMTQSNADQTPVNNFKITGPKKNTVISGITGMISQPHIPSDAKDTYQSESYAQSHIIPHIGIKGPQSVSQIIQGNQRVFPQRRRPMLPEGAIPGESSLPPPSRRRPIITAITGEGTCLFRKRVYQNGQRMESTSICKVNCQCINSVVHCDHIICPRPPLEKHIKCTPVYSPDRCCPRYDCRVPIETSSTKKTYVETSPNQPVESSSTQTTLSVQSIEYISSDITTEDTSSQSITMFPIQTPLSVQPIKNSSDEVTDVETSPVQSEPTYSAETPLTTNPYLISSPETTVKGISYVQLDDTSLTKINLSTQSNNFEISTVQPSVMQSEETNLPAQSIGNLSTSSSNKETLSFQPIETSLPENNLSIQDNEISSSKITATKSSPDQPEKTLTQSTLSIESVKNSLVETTNIKASSYETVQTSSTQSTLAMQPFETFSTIVPSEEPLAIEDTQVFSVQTSLKAQAFDNSSIEIIVEGSSVKPVESFLSQTTFSVQPFETSSEIIATDTSNVQPTQTFSSKTTSATHSIAPSEITTIEISSGQPPENILDQTTLEAQTVETTSTDTTATKTTLPLQLFEVSSSETSTVETSSVKSFETFTNQVKTSLTENTAEIISPIQAVNISLDKTNISIQFNETPSAEIITTESLSLHKTSLPEIIAVETTTQPIETFSVNTTLVSKSFQSSSAETTITKILTAQTVENILTKTTLEVQPVGNASANKTVLKLSSVQSAETTLPAQHFEISSAETVAIGTPSIKPFETLPIQTSEAFSDETIVADTSHIQYIETTSNQTTLLIPNANTSSVELTDTQNPIEQTTETILSQTTLSEKPIETSSGETNAVKVSTRQPVYTSSSNTNLSKQPTETTTVKVNIAKTSYGQPIDIFSAQNTLSAQTNKSLAETTNVKFVEAFSTETISAVQPVKITSIEVTSVETTSLEPVENFSTHSTLTTEFLQTSPAKTSSTNPVQMSSAQNTLFVEHGKSSTSEMTSKEILPDQSVENILTHSTLTTESLETSPEKSSSIHPVEISSAKTTLFVEHVKSTTSGITFKDTLPGQSVETFSAQSSLTTEFLTSPEEISSIHPVEISSAQTTSFVEHAKSSTSEITPKETSSGQSVEDLSTQSIFTAQSFETSPEETSSIHPIEISSDQTSFFEHAKSSTSEITTKETLPGEAIDNFSSQSTLTTQSFATSPEKTSSIHPIEISSAQTSFVEHVKSSTFEITPKETSPGQSVENLSTQSTYTAQSFETSPEETSSIHPIEISSAQTSFLEHAKSSTSEITPKETLPGESIDNFSFQSTLTTQSFETSSEKTSSIHPIEISSDQTTSFVEHAKSSTSEITPKETLPGESIDNFSSQSTLTTQSFETSPEKTSSIHPIEISSAQTSFVEHVKSSIFEITPKETSPGQSDENLSTQSTFTAQSFETSPEETSSIHPIEISSAQTTFVEHAKSSTSEITPKETLPSESIDNFSSQSTLTTQSFATSPEKTSSIHPIEISSAQTSFVEHVKSSTFEITPKETSLGQSVENLSTQSTFTAQSFETSPGETSSIHPVETSSAETTLFVERVKLSTSEITPKETSPGHSVETFPTETTLSGNPVKTSDEMTSSKMSTMQPVEISSRETILIEQPLKNSSAEMTIVEVSSVQPFKTIPTQTAEAFSSKTIVETVDGSSTKPNLSIQFDETSSTDTVIEESSSVEPLKTTLTEKSVKTSSVKINNLKASSDESLNIFSTPITLSAQSVESSSGKMTSVDLTTIQSVETSSVQKITNTPTMQPLEISPFSNINENITEIATHSVQHNYDILLNDNDMQTAENIFVPESLILNKELSTSDTHASISTESDILKEILVNVTTDIKSTPIYSELSPNLTHTSDATVKEITLNVSPGTSENISHETILSDVINMQNKSSTKLFTLPVMIVKATPSTVITSSNFTQAESESVLTITEVSVDSEKLYDDGFDDTKTFFTTPSDTNSSKMSISSENITTTLLPLEEANIFESPLNISNKTTNIESDAKGILSIATNISISSEIPSSSEKTIYNLKQKKPLVFSTAMDDTTLTSVQNLVSELEAQSTMFDETPTELDNTTFTSTTSPIKTKINFSQSITDSQTFPLFINDSLYEHHTAEDSKEQLPFIPENITLKSVLTEKLPTTFSAETNITDAIPVFGITEMLNIDYSNESDFNFTEVKEHETSSTGVHVEISESELQVHEQPNSEKENVPISEIIDMLTIIPSNQFQEIHQLSSIGKENFEIYENTSNSKKEETTIYTQEKSDINVTSLDIPDQLEVEESTTKISFENLNVYSVPTEQTIINPSIYKPTKLKIKETEVAYQNESSVTIPSEYKSTAKELVYQSTERFSLDKELTQSDTKIKDDITNQLKIKEQTDATIQNLATTLNYLSPSKINKDATVSNTAVESITTLQDSSKSDHETIYQTSESNSNELEIITEHAQIIHSTIQPTINIINQSITNKEIPPILTNEYGQEDVQIVNITKSPIDIIYNLTLQYEKDLEHSEISSTIQSHLYEKSSATLPVTNSDQAYDENTSSVEYFITENTEITSRPLNTDNNFNISDNAKNKSIHSKNNETELKFSNSSDTTSHYPKIPMKPLPIIKPKYPTPIDIITTGVTYTIHEDITKMIATKFPTNPPTVVYEINDTEKLGASTSEIPHPEEDEMCYYDGEVYFTSEQIPQRDNCEFCFCFKGDVICLQQTCPPPISGCYAIPIDGFCCPRFHCPVQQLWLNASLTTPPPPPRLPYGLGNQKTQTQTGCEIIGQMYHLGQIVWPASNACIICRCDYGGIMKCDPRACKPKDSMLQQIVEEYTKKK